MSLKLLYLYPGDRRGKYDKPGSFPNTGAYGLPFMAEFGIDAKSAHIGDVLPKWLERKLPFIFKHILSWVLVKDVDVVIGPSLLYTAVLPKRAKFVLLNFSVNRQLAVHNSGWKRKLLLKQLRKMDAVISLSHVQHNELLRACPELEGKAHVVKLGVDEKFYTPKCSGRDTFILSGGRDDGRDYKTLFDAARLLPEKKFVVFCSRRNVKGLDIPSNVDIRFDVVVEDLRDLYQNAQMLVLSTHPDGYIEGSDCSGQTVLLDAMASCMPIVATRKEYIKDYAEDGKEISLVEAHNPKEMASAISNIKYELGSAARERVERELTSRHMAQEIANIVRVA